MTDPIDTVRDPHLERAADAVGEAFARALAPPSRPASLWERLLARLGEGRPAEAARGG
jgi:hypothetical protein